MNLEEISQRVPEDAEIIRFLAERHVFFFDGDGVVLNFGRKLTGAEMRALIKEAGYDPLTRDGDRNDPESPMYWGKDQAAAPMFAVVFDEGDVHDVHGPFTDLNAAIDSADVDGGKVRPLIAPSPIPGRVKVEATTVTVGTKP